MTLMKAGKCVYCLNWFENLTEDHVFSRKWYPDSTPATIEKWVVPACSKCNHNYGLIEQELLIRMGLCLDPKDRQSFGVVQRALRSINPKLAKNDSDRAARERLRRRILGDTWLDSSPPKEGLLPNFGPQTDREYHGKYLMIKIPNNLLEELGRKFVRGLTFRLEDGLLITPEKKIEIFFPEDQNVGWVIDLIERNGYQDYRGPGIKIHRAIGNLQHTGGLYRIVVWGRWTIYAAILPIHE